MNMPPKMKDPSGENDGGTRHWKNPLFSNG
jgi:hypothetical protein